MNLRVRLATLALALGAISAAMLGGCDADVEEGCVSGTCGGATVAQATSATTTTDAASSASAGQGGAGGSGAAACIFPDTGELPCAVYEIVVDSCQKCHQDPPVSGAPFPLLTWNDFQEDYFGMTRWERAALAIEPGAIPHMPFDQPDGLPEAQLDVLRAWFDTCRAGECAKEPSAGEGGGGRGGAGGAGGS